MSNIRPIGDPSIATAMVATFQSIDSARSAPAGISAPRWRILQCIGKAAPFVPSPAELLMCSGLNKADLAEHLQSLRWKGLIEMGGYRLSPSAAAMLGLERPYPPKDAKAMKFAEPELSLADIGPLPTAPAFVGVVDGPDIVAAALMAFGADGKIAKVEPLSRAKAEPLDPADVAACMRPDCTPPELDHAISTSHLVGDRPNPRKPTIKSRAEREQCRQQRLETNKHGRGSSAVERPTVGTELGDRVAPDGISDGASAIAQVRILPPANPPKANWIADRFQRTAGAIAFLKSLGILVTVVDRDAPIREYYVSGKRYRQLAEEVIEIAIAKGWAE